MLSVAKILIKTEFSSTIVSFLLIWVVVAYYKVQMEYLGRVRG